MTRKPSTSVIGLLALLSFLGLPALPEEPVTAEQVVARCQEAMGGADKVRVIQTLRFTVSYADKKGTHVTEIKRPNRIRTEADAILVFDGKRAGFLKGAPSTDGRDPGPQPVPPENSRDFEVDIAFLFPAFLDYPAEYLGLETAGGNSFHKLGVTLPLGIRMTYFLDAKTFLTNKIVADFPFQEVVYHPQRVVSDYVKVEGVRFPRSFESTGWGEKGRATVKSVEVNVPLADDRFQMP